MKFCGHTLIFRTLIFRTLFGLQLEVSKHGWYFFLRNRFTSGFSDGSDNFFLEHFFLEITVLHCLDFLLALHFVLN